MQQVKSYLHINLIIFFTIIKDLFNHLENIFINFYQKNYTIKNFQELKIGTNLFNNLFFQFIQLASNLKYTSKILIWEFKYKLILRWKD